MNINTILKEQTAKAIQELFSASIEVAQVNINETRKEFEGDATVLVFPFTKISRQAPEATGTAIGNYLLENVKEVTAFNVVKGFLNLSIANNYWLQFFTKESENSTFGYLENTNKKIILEYCGPNTNKPLHLGHIRNMLLGYATANLLQTAGNTVHKVNIYNDRGIAICKSMLAWQKFGKGETPETSGIKGDHLVGKYYVKFDSELRKEIDQLVADGMPKKEAEKNAPILQEAQEMLRQWENGNEEILQLWQTMNNWVYQGFEKTFATLGIDFEKHYKESEYYLKGKEFVLEGVAKGLFQQKEDGAIFVDLSDEDLDEKILVRSDGTSVYMTQDMGIAQARYEDYHFDQMIYVVGQEQDYHFKVLKKVIHKLGNDYSDSIFHFSYGMVNLPEGKMKSREGTVVDADDLIESMIKTATEHTQELGKVDELSAEEVKVLNYKIAMAALKFFILKVNPKKSVLFNPKESIDFQGNTGPFIQYTYARISSMLQGQNFSVQNIDSNIVLDASEKDLLKELHKLPLVIASAAANYDVSELASYIYSIAKTYNKFYATVSILKAETEALKNFRLCLSAFTAKVIKQNLAILGIDVPQRM